MQVTLTHLDPSWAIDTSDGRAWFTGPGDEPITGIRGAYPLQCRELRKPGDRVTFEDVKGYFARGAGWQRILQRKQRRKR